jgi:hypothetical protein
MRAARNNLRSPVAKRRRPSELDIGDCDRGGGADLLKHADDLLGERAEQATQIIQLADLPSLTGSQSTGDGYVPIARIADMEAQTTTVSTSLASKGSIIKSNTAATPRNTPPAPT